MNRLFCLGAMLALANHVPAFAQQQEPPKKVTNDLGTVFVWIPPGNFVMGSPKQEEGRFENEVQHKVTLTKGFYIGAYAVTQDQWQAIMGHNPSHFKGEKNLPVEKVSWNDCQAFIKKLREKDKRSYRLPTEAEWEYACRAGKPTAFPTGAAVSTAQANFNDYFTYGNATRGEFRGKTTPVGAFPANAWGLYDMPGNIWQWCQDWYGEYGRQDVVDPQGPEKGMHRVLRGGSWLSRSQCCRSAYRSEALPGHRDFASGFRLCYFAEKL